MPLNVLAPELVQHIAFHAVADVLGPPLALVALQRTCRSLHAVLAPAAAPYLHARVFRAMFDAAAPERRFGPHARRPSVLAAELARRCALLRRIRSGDVAGPHVHADLWLAYLMMIENDGRNARQLVRWAGIADFVVLFLRTRLYEGCSANNGWPLESESNALAVWILWLASDEASIRAERPEYRKFILDALQPFVIAPYKYQPLFVPEVHFLLPLPQGVYTFTPTPHGPFPIYRPVVPKSSIPRVLHFGLPLNVCAPPLTPAALLCMHARLQLGVVQPPKRIIERRSMLPPGVIGTTLEDYVEVRTQTLTKCVSWGSDETTAPSLDEDADNERDAMKLDRGSDDVPSGSWGSKPASLQHEYDWTRITHFYDPWLYTHNLPRAYTPGMLSGLWTGRLFHMNHYNSKPVFPSQVYDFTQYTEIAHNPDIHPRLAQRTSTSAEDNPGSDYAITPDAGLFPAAYQVPLFMRLREHHCLPGTLPVAWGNDLTDSGADINALRRAWFPPECDYEERNGKLSVYNRVWDELLEYETYIPGRPSTHVAAGGCSRCNPDSDADPDSDHPLPQGSRSVWPTANSDCSSCPSDPRISSQPTESPQSTQENFDGLYHDSNACSQCPSQAPYPAHPSYPVHVDANPMVGGLPLNNGPERKSGTEEMICACAGSGAKKCVDASEDSCVRDIIVTGETDPEHGRAWGSYRFVGRIRDRDGLVVLLRIPVEPNTRGAGTFVFRGYIHSNQNFVGRWRPAGEPSDSFAALEGSFSLCKRA
ncbi:hypothetical protein M0805_007265 [Coniferiporia weirii]|nr:hypothetical protein M0805_007265 [Coniferiporia weirii]